LGSIPITFCSYAGVTTYKREETMEIELLEAVNETTGKKIYKVDVGNMPIETIIEEINKLQGTIISVTFED
jgi:hypothetical protein